MEREVEEKKEEKVENGGGEMKPLAVFTLLLVSLSFSLSLYVDVYPCCSSPRRNPGSCGPRFFSQTVACVYIHRPYALLIPTQRVNGL